MFCLSFLKQPWLSINTNAEPQELCSTSASKAIHEAKVFLQV